MNWKKELYPSSHGRLILNFTDASVMFALDTLSSSECGAYARKTHTLTRSHTCKKNYTANVWLRMHSFGSHLSWYHDASFCETDAWTKKYRDQSTLQKTILWFCKMTFNLGHWSPIEFQKKYAGYFMKYVLLKCLFYWNMKHIVKYEGECLQRWMNR